LRGIPIFSCRVEKIARKRELCCEGAKRKRKTEKEIGHQSLTSWIIFKRGPGGKRENGLLDTEEIGHESYRFGRGKNIKERRT